MKNFESLYEVFRPELTPKQMLEYGVFGGSYLGDTINESVSYTHLRAHET